MATVHKFNTFHEAVGFLAPTGEYGVEQPCGSYTYSPEAPPSGMPADIAGTVAGAVMLDDRVAVRMVTNGPEYKLLGYILTQYTLDLQIAYCVVLKMGNPH